MASWHPMSLSTVAHVALVAELFRDQVGVAGVGGGSTAAQPNASEFERLSCCWLGAIRLLPGWADVWSAATRS